MSNEYWSKDTDRYGDKKVCEFKDDAFESFCDGWVPLDPQPCCENCEKGSVDDDWIWCDVFKFELKKDFYCKYWERKE